MNRFSRLRRSSVALMLAATASLPAARARAAEKQAVLVLATVEKDAGARRRPDQESSSRASRRARAPK